MQLVPRICSSMGVARAAANKRMELVMTDNRQTSKERLRRRLIRGVLFAVAGFAATIISIGKNWNQNHTFGLIFGLVMMAGILIYALSLKSGSDIQE